MSEEDDTRVVLRQNLLKVEEVFVYRIPPMRTADGHRAEDWDLGKPLETCSLSVERLDDSLLIQLMTAKPKEGGPKGATEPNLFAVCQILLRDKQRKVAHWVEAVVDSSRYFVVRISDGKREAHVGMGFRERDDASNFKMSLLEYENALRRERKAEAMHMAYEESSSQSESGSETGAAAAASAVVSKLSLKEGEKIHINLKGAKKARKETTTTTTSGKAGGGPVLLKKPPPSPMPPTAQQEEIAISLADMQLVNEKYRGSKPSSELDSSEGAVAGSEGALADADDVDDDDDDEWDEFQG